MNNLVIRQDTLPEAPVDLAKFVLFAPEKATAMRAEIRAMKNLHLAQEVVEQKQKELNLLAALTMDAKTRLGEFTRELPKSQGGRPSKTLDSGVCSFKPKSEAVRELGLSPKQVERFEALADNKDLVEQEKATAHEEMRAPTVSNVLSLAKARKDRYERDIAQIDADGKLAKAFVKAAYAVQELPDASEVATALIRNAGGNIESLAGDIENAETAIARFREIQNELRKEAAKNGRI